MSRFDALLALSCLFDFMVFAVLLWLSARHVSSKGTMRVGAGILLAALCGAIGIVAAKTLTVAVLGLEVFGLIHLLYLDLALVAPAVGVLILVFRVMKVPGVGSVSFGACGTIAALCSFLLIPLCVYTTYVEPFNLKVESCDVVAPRMASDKSHIKIAVLADMQFDEVTAHEHRAVDLAMQANPDLILIPGDVFQGVEKQYRVQESAIKSLLAKLEAPGGVYVVSGDCDRLSTLTKAIAGSQIQLIDNQIKQVEVRGTTIAVAGIPIEYRSSQAKDTLYKASTIADRTDLTIVLAHRPGISLLPYMPDNIDLIVAGHTHGGQIQIPGFGPPVTASPVPKVVAAGGLSELNDHLLYVSRGVGCERGHAPRIRFCCPPEVSILTVGGSPTHVALKQTPDVTGSDLN
ncbi:MAG: metallophosphoesterase [Phycisphaerales bacterium]|nr:metallophosphoesterase [Phycisphaerales bacterium]